MVKCSECGLLAVRAATSRNLVEAEKGCRKTGNFNIYTRSSQGSQMPYYALPPLCFAQVIDMREEINKAAGMDNPDYSRDPVSIHLVLHEERKCNEFVMWQQGFTPKEHREMLDRRWERKWRIITGIIFIILAGLFTLLGAYIANLN